MSAWGKIDELRHRVVARPLVEIEVGPIKTVKDAQEALKEINFKPDRLVALGWEILLSRRKQEGLVRWHLSVKRLPGRPTTAEDWQTVGRIAARVGAPRDPALMPKDPSAAVHWSWTEQ